MTLGQFLQLMNSDLQNEWTHLQYYLYHASYITGLHAAEYKEFFTDAAKGEMQHVRQFLDRLLGLGCEFPNTCGKQFKVWTKVADALQGAIDLENEVVQNYSQRLTQLDAMAAEYPVQAAYLKVFYEDQLQDSYEDCEHLRRILADNLVNRFRVADLHTTYNYNKNQNKI